MAKVDSRTAAVYKNALKLLNSQKIPFLLGGAFASAHYLGQTYQVNDLDLFCKGGDYPKILDLLSNEGFKSEVTDEKWVAKALKGKAQVDLIFSSPNGVNMVDDSWFRHGQKSQLFGQPIKVVGPTELIWTKLYIQKSTRFDGAVINHLLLKLADKLDWQNILTRMEAHWELLLGALINFRFVYPSERQKIPDWLMKELLQRLRLQLKAPAPKDRLCRGPLLDRQSYQADIIEGGFII